MKKNDWLSSHDKQRDVRKTPMMRKFFHYFWSMIVHPKATIEELAQETSLRYAVVLVLFSLALTLFNLLLFAICGFDWLGTRRELPSPTYIGFFGRLSVGTDDYVTIFNFLINPLMALVGLTFIPGLAHLLAKIWRGAGTFEQMVNTLVFATGGPSIVISSVLNDMLLAGVLPNLLTGHPYAFTAAQTGEFGASVQTLWWVYMIGIYIFAKDAWAIALGTLAIRHIQKIPIWAAALIMLFGYTLWYYGMAGTFVR